MLLAQRSPCNGPGISMPGLLLLVDVQHDLEWYNKNKLSVFQADIRVAQSRRVYEKEEGITGTDTIRFDAFIPVHGM